jgi:hypothetical protein
VTWQEYETGTGLVRFPELTGTLARNHDVHLSSGITNRQPNCDSSLHMTSEAETDRAPQIFKASKYWDFNVWGAVVARPCSSVKLDRNKKPCRANDAS